MIQKVVRLRWLIEEKQANVLIEIGAGVYPRARKLLFDVGVDVLVAGSFVFSAEYPKMTIHQLKNN